VKRPPPLATTRTTPLALALAALLLAPLAAHALQPTALRTEFLENPLGLDTAKPRFSWLVEDSAQGAKQTGYHVQVSSSEENLAKGEADLWDSGKVVSDQSHLVGYAGQPLASRQQAWWRVRSWNKEGKESAWSKPACFELALLEEKDWTAPWIRVELPPENNDAAKAWMSMATVPVVEANVLRPRNNKTEGPLPSEVLAKAEQRNLSLLEKFSPCPLLRREVEIPGTVRRARAYVAAPGFLELRVNGRKVGDRELEPGVTPFRKQVLYSVHDITPFLREGKNALGLILGHGWFDSGDLGHAVPAGTAPVTRAQFEIELTDGRRLTVDCNGDWKFAPGPILKDSQWIGECYDARREPSGWDQPGFDDDAWRACATTESPTQAMTPDLVPPERVVRRIKAKSLSSPAPGVWVYDMGEAFSGAAELKVNVPAGTVLTLRYAQRIFAPDQPLGSLLRYADGVATERTPGGLAPYQAGDGLPPKAIDGSEARLRHHPFTPTDVYAAAGGREEVWRRRFGYTGYRYVELTGYPGQPPEDTVTGVVVHTDLPREGSFECANPLLNRVHAACLNTYLYCTHGFTHDNPTREKQFCPEMTSGCARLSATAFPETELWSKIIEASLLTQDASGHFRQFCDFRASPEQPVHEDGPIRLAYLLWLRYGDDSLLRRGLDKFAAYFDYYWNNPQNTRDRSLGRKDFLAAPDLSQGYLRGGFFCFDWYDGDTVLDLKETFHPPRERQRPLWGTAVLYENLQMFLTMAAHAGREDLVAKYRPLGEKAREEWNRTFFDPATGSYGCQGNDALALVSGLAPADQVPAVAAALVSGVEKLDGRFTTGTHGFPRLLEALSTHGRADLAYGMLARETYPSIGHMLQSGHGTVFENWNTLTNPTGATGASVIQSERPRAGFWFAEWLGGIRADPTHPGFQQVILNPVFPPQLESARAEVPSPYGKVTSAWKREGDSIRWQVTVPWNSRATVKLPGSRKITVNGRPQSKQEFELAAGKWEITLSSSRPTATGTPR